LTLPKVSEYFTQAEPDAAPDVDHRYTFQPNPLSNRALTDGQLMGELSSVQEQARVHSGLRIAICQRELTPVMSGSIPGIAA
jgi:hypothetical protein